MNITQIKTQSFMQLPQSPASPSPSNKIIDTIAFRPTSLELEAAQKMDWKDRLIAVLDKGEAKLEKLMPNFKIQNDFDVLWQELNQHKVHPDMAKFNSWLRDNGQGAWYTQLATYLLKLPLRAACNVMHLLFNFIKLAVKIAVCVPTQIAMHPLKAPIKLAKLLVQLIHNLAQPETWSKIGMGLMGSSLGYAAISGGSLGVITLGIGAALTIGGISLGTIKTALIADRRALWHDVKTYLLEQAKQLPEDFLTGFCTVMFLEGIHQVMRGIQKLHHANMYSIAKRNSRIAFSKEQVDAFYHKHPYPHYDRIKYNNNSVSISWHHRTFDRFGLPPSSAAGETFFTECVHTRNIYSTSWAYNYSTGQMESIITSTPVYEEFLGYRIPIDGWQAPLKPAIGAAVRVSDKIIPTLGLDVALDVVTSQPAIAKAS